MSATAAVLIPTNLRRPGLLDAVLSSLIDELCGKVPRLEILVGLDVNSDSNTAKFPGQCRTISTQCQGAAAVRNHLAAATKAEQLVFLDDDMRPEVGWFAQLEVLLVNQERAYAGAIRRPEQNWQSLNGVSRLEQSRGIKWFGPTTRILGPLEHMAAGHCIVPREPFLTIGGFRSIDGGRNEDVDMHRRLYYAGYPVHWAPDLRATHLGYVDCESFDWQAQGVADAITDTQLPAMLRYRRRVSAIARFSRYPGQWRYSAAYGRTWLGYVSNRR